DAEDVVIGATPHDVLRMKKRTGRWGDRCERAAYAALAFGFGEAFVGLVSDFGFSRFHNMAALLLFSEENSAALSGASKSGASRETEMNSRPCSLVRFQAAPSSTWPCAVSEMSR